MKRKIFVSILAVAALLLIVSCENIINEIIHSNSNVKYKVYFDTGEGSWPNGSPGVEFKYDYQKRIYYRVVGYKARVPEPSYRPQAFEKDFDCWTLNGIEFNFGLIISGDITLVAKYKETSSTTG